MIEGYDLIMKSYVPPEKACADMKAYLMKWTNWPHNTGIIEDEPSDPNSFYFYFNEAAKKAWDEGIQTENDIMINVICENGFVTVVHDNYPNFPVNVDNFRSILKPNKSFFNAYRPYRQRCIEGPTIHDELLGEHVDFKNKKRIRCYVSERGPNSGTVVTERGLNRGTGTLTSGSFNCLNLEVYSRRKHPEFVLEQWREITKDLWIKEKSSKYTGVTWGDDYNHPSPDEMSACWGTVSISWENIEETVNNDLVVSYKGLKLMTEEPIAPDVFLESMSKIDEIIDHNIEVCGMCYHQRVMADVAREMIQEGVTEDIINTWNTRAEARWQSSKFFKLYTEEKAAGRDPEVAFFNNGWEL